MNIRIRPVIAGLPLSPTLGANQSALASAGGDRIENVLLCLIAGYDSVQGTAGSIFVTDLACSDRYGSEPR